MPLTGTTSAVISNIAYSTVLSFDGDTFDANQVGYATAVYANGSYSIYYAGLAFSNAKELGLATSIDPLNFIRHSNDPIVSPAEEPGFASFRLLPSTVMYEGGIYRMWFFGIDSNSVCLRCRSRHASSPKTSTGSARPSASAHGVSKTKDGKRFMNAPSRRVSWQHPPPRQHQQFKH